MGRTSADALLYTDHPPQRGDISVTAGRRPADTAHSACSQRPRRGRTSADALLYADYPPQRGDTLVTAGRRPADTGRTAYAQSLMGQHLDVYAGIWLKEHHLSHGFAAQVFPRKFNIELQFLNTRRVLL